MSIKRSRGVLLGSVAGAAAALGLTLASVAQAQPYYSSDAADGAYAKASNADMPYNASDSGYDASATVGGLTVTAPGRTVHTASGAEIVTAAVSRVVDTSDLDLSTRDGMHELRSRVENAASYACDQLDNEPGMVPVDGNDAACFHHAVDDAMSEVNSPY